MSLLAKIAAVAASLAKPLGGLPAPLYPEATSEVSLLSHLLADPALGPTIDALGMPAADLRSRVATYALHDVVKSNAHYKLIRAGAAFVATGTTGRHDRRRLPQQDLLAFLITLGSDEMRELIATTGIAPGAISFWIAHQDHERVLRAHWPEPSVASPRVAVVNDPYSPMEAVHRFLAEAFVLSDDKAAQLMLRVHHEGTVHLDLPEGTSAVAFCEQCNLKWRRPSGIPLYVRPVAV